MCGIVAIVRNPVPTKAPASDELLAPMEAAGLSVAAVAGSVDAEGGAGALEAAAEQVRMVDGRLRPLGGIAVLVGDPALSARLAAAAGEIEQSIGAIETQLASGAVDSSRLEAFNAGLQALKDAVWMVSRDRLRTATEVRRFVSEDAAASDEATISAIAAYASVQQALSALDRLEVRGRDSAGIEIFVSGHGLDATDNAVAAELAGRDRLVYTSGAVRVSGTGVSFVYKAAAEIGELGDNTASLRAQIHNDQLLRRAVSAAGAHAMVLAHTRWASIGVISEPNAHPQSSDGLAHSAEFSTAALNGDVDNYADLAAAERLEWVDEISTDAKVIPTMFSRRVSAGMEPSRAFRETVSIMEGSVAIASHLAASPAEMFFALRGSGQALYVGVAEDVYVVASEPYGLVEECGRYLRMDGETPSNPQNPTASRGQLIELSAAKAGTVEGIRRWSYDGTELPVTDADMTSAEITTRDIDRGEFPHFLLKELGDAPGSFRKTLRGKLIERPEGIEVVLSESTIPNSVREALGSGSVTRILVIGQGTAAVAGESLAYCLSDLMAESEISVSALPATELSGFHLRDDMSDTLAIAISQSGTTTDTNRTVDILRGRGAKVIAIVNRRGSDLVDKSDGVLYTADGRDVEMSVASTKAFYSQIAAGFLLAYGLAALAPGGRSFTDRREQEVLADLARIPELMERTLALREDCGVAARRFAMSRRYWAIVGNGPNKIAAREVRIKLSELCYRSIACDSTEDKKHIDLSCEPLILVCAAGLVGSTADDVAKEVAIFKAHKAAPIVVASEGANGFSAASHVVYVPEVHPRLAFVLSAMVGHLFGYEAALAIDAQAVPLREARGLIDGLRPVEGKDPRSSIREGLTRSAAAFFAELRSGDLNGNLEASTASRLASLIRFAVGGLPLDAYEIEFGRKGSPGVVLDDLSAALSLAIDELTRPIDAIKHQAKTVTVGISRSDESVLQVPLVRELMDSGASRDRLSYATLRSLADLNPAVAEVTGYVRYAVEDVNGDHPQISIVDRGGVAAGFPSRIERDPRLRGTKHLVARELELMVSKGRSDGRTVVIVPESKDGECTGIDLLHVELVDRLDASTARGILAGYRRRYQALSDAVTETEEFFRDDILAEQPVVDLLIEPILDLAERWRQSA
jgi:glucosamine--fructose-6-phosphate aminotransferase (isomerizing)